MQAVVTQLKSSFYIQPYADEYKDGVRLLIPAIQQEHGIPITYEDQPDLQNIQAVYRKGKGNFWVALDDHQVIGSIALIDAGEDIGVLRKMFVHKDYRGSAIGVGQALFNTCLEWAGARDIRIIYLGTNEKFQAACRFYEKNGFGEVETLPDVVECIRMKVDNKHYYRKITA